MNTFGKLLVAGGFALMASAGAAQAGTYQVQVYNGVNTGGKDAYENAVAGKDSIFADTTAYVGTYTYTGNINFSAPKGSPNNIAFFMDSAGGVWNPSDSGLSTTDFTGSGFSRTTGFAFTFTGYAGENLKINDDDGVSLYAGAFSVPEATNDLLPLASGDPTASGSNFVTLTSTGTYTLYYIEANGLPATLKMVIPEPVSMSLLGAGLLGLGLARRRRQNKA